MPTCSRTRWCWMWAAAPASSASSQPRWVGTGSVAGGGGGVGVAGLWPGVGMGRLAEAIKLALAVRMCGRAVRHCGAGCGGVDVWLCRGRGDEAVVAGPLGAANPCLLQAGAKHVYGVDMSQIAESAQQIVKDNGFADRCASWCSGNSCSRGGECGGGCRAGQWLCGQVRCSELLKGSVGHAGAGCWGHVVDCCLLCCSLLLLCCCFPSLRALGSSSFTLPDLFPHLPPAPPHITPSCHPARPFPHPHTHASLSPLQGHHHPWED